MFWENIWNRKKSFLKIELMYKDKSQGSYMEPLSKPVLLDVESESFRLSLVKMSERDFKELPEFTGF